ncbi:putative LysM domain protein [Aspergillus lucknowensis]|uniref:LysM domain protein n=1 Tax=Aspergillus lucknowensis TaxID=176173 RepID=A0ABR4LQS5_9EURO
MSSRSGSADTFTPRTTTESTQRSASTVRPRRLISFTDDDGDHIRRQSSSTGLSTTRSSEIPTLRSRGATPSPRPSRTVSPIPMSHPSRVTQSQSGSRPGNSLGGFRSDGKYQDPFAEPSRAAAEFLDASWSSLQSLASSLLGSDIAQPAANGTPRTHARKPSRPEYFTRFPSRTSTTSTWGPSAPSTPEIGAGTQEERQAMVQAKKREALLLADTDNGWSLNSRHKRRDSSDQTGQSGIHTDQDEEALVYVHQVQPSDSITSVTIKYGCQAAIFRKANGFWPSDSIQGRKTVLLPVDCCSIKGRPLQSQQADSVQNLRSRQSIEDTSGSSIVPEAISDTPTFPTDPAPAGAETGVEGDQVWKHESWVQVDGFPAPVQIGRVSRRALGYFPRSRRKSLCYSDTEPVRGREKTPTISPATSPVEPASIQSPDGVRDQLRPDSSEARIRGSSKPGGRHRRQRSGLELSGTGVGTLDRSVNIPGPAMDGLSKFFAQHLPNLAPKQPSPSFEGLNGNSSTVASSNSNSLDSIGGAVEGWVRKMTARAKTGFSDLQQGTSPSQGHGLSQDAGRRWTGDLIELDDGMEPRNSFGLLSGPSWRPDFNQSVSSLSNGANLRGRFPNASPSTSRSRVGHERFKDD